MTQINNEQCVVNKKGEKRGLQAKAISLKSQILASIWIAGWAAYKFTRTGAVIEISDIIFSGLGIAACFSPVYLSIVMDKIKEIRFGGTTQ